MRYKLKKNAYLPVTAQGLEFTRHYEKGTVFQKVCKAGNGSLLLKAEGDNVTVYVGGSRLQECFEEIWNLPKDTKARFYTGDDE